MLYYYLFLLVQLSDTVSITTVGGRDRCGKTGVQNGAGSHHIAEISRSRCNKNVGTQLFDISLLSTVKKNNTLLVAYFAH